MSLSSTLFQSLIASFLLNIPPSDCAAKGNPLHFLTISFPIISRVSLSSQASEVGKAWFANTNQQSSFVNLFRRYTSTQWKGRDVKMSFNPWANPAHHGFEPGWVEKNSTFSKVGWTQPGSLNPRVKWVRAGLKVGWPT